MPQFDVFLCYNREDLAAVSKVADALTELRVRPWLDVRELQPGLPWQRVVEEQIGNIDAVAVFVGANGTGPWQQLEVEAWIRKFVSRGCPVIPVVLEGAAGDPALPTFLEGMTWVDFRRASPDPLRQLVWGITGRRPHREASTGEAGPAARALSGVSGSVGVELVIHGDVQAWEPERRDQLMRAIGMLAEQSAITVRSGGAGSAGQRVG